MKRWIVAALVILALLILVAPGIIGRVAERNLEQNLNWAASESSNIEISTERFERGWFTSEGRHRVSLHAATFGEAIREYRASSGNDELPSLIIDTSVDHGPVPVGDAGSLAPGLANMLSTFQIDPGNGELVELPGSLRSKVGLSGATSSLFLLETGEFENSMARVEWQGADIALQTDWSDGTLIVDGRIEPLNIATDDQSLRVGAIDIVANQVRGDYGFNEGSTSIELESIVIEAPGNSFAIGALAFSAMADIDDTRLNFGSRVSVAEVDIPALGAASFILDMAFERLDAASMQTIIRTLRDAQAAADPKQALADARVSMEADLQRLAAAGAGIRIEQLDILLPQGTLSTRLKIDIPERDAGKIFTWSGVLLTTTASADIRVPTGLFELLLVSYPQANSLVAMGFLQRDGTDLVLNAEFAQGQLKVNGAPLPIPGLQ